MTRGHYIIFVTSANHKSHRTTCDWCVSTPTIAGNTAVTAHIHPSKIAGNASVPHSYDDIHLAWRYSQVHKNAAHIWIVVSCDKVFLVNIREGTQEVPETPAGEISVLNDHLDQYFRQFGFESRCGYAALIETVELLRQMGMEQRALQKLEDFLAKAPGMGTVIQGIVMTKALMMANMYQFEFYSGQFPEGAGELRLTLGSSPLYS